MTIIQLRTDESKLIEEALQQDRKAQQLIYNRYSPKMLSVCRLYIKDLQQAEDVLLKSFFKVFTQLHQFKHEGSFEGWIRRIVVNNCISYLRSYKRPVFIEDHYEMGYSEEIDIVLDSNQIQQLIDELPVGYQMVFNLSVIEGYKHKDIAEILQIKEGTSRSQLAHAKQMLREKIEKLHVIAQTK